MSLRVHTLLLRFAVMDYCAGFAGQWALGALKP
jgi:hypothetical protein